MYWRIADRPNLENAFMIETITQAGACSSASLPDTDRT